ncbi:MAG: hypothetical protein P8103_03265 [Candidatus Thiodiazotropha sp.]
MTKYAQLAEQHITEYESRLKHIDELLTRAREGVSHEQHELAPELEDLTAKREALAKHLEEMRSKTFEEWQEKEIKQAGPMGVWDAVAQKLEELTEKLGS